MPTYRYTLTNSHSATGLTGDHYHSIEVSSLNAGVKANIPQYSKINSIYLYCSAKTSISSKADAWWYFGNSSPYRDGYKICGGTEIIGTSNATISGNIPASMYTSSASNSGTLLTQYSRLAITMTATIVRKFTCNSAYAEWTYTLPTYTINLSANGGGTVSGGGTQEITQFNDQITSGGSWTFKAKANSGYRFVGWRRVGFTGYISYDETYTYTRSSIYSNAITESIEGVFVKTYTVNYNGNGATDGYVNPQSAVFGEDITLQANGFDKSYVVTLDSNYDDPSLLLDFWTSTAFFVGWEDRTGITASSGRNFSYTEFDAPFYANTYGDLYTAFGYNKLSLVDHYVNNGIAEGRSAVGATRGTYPARAVVNSLTTAAGGTVELYAQWTKMSSIPLPSRTRSGYTFLGWFTEPTGGTRIGGGGDIYTPTSDITLYAHWQFSSFLYVKKNGSFVAANKVYMKKNGVWVEVTDKSEINTDIKYRMISS